ncbi:uncharacterized protein LOC133452277 [Cololabis saira]|uniref:uncharacterized protein LOC133452277 n=1 Tax=Cololabis saira TaxID=129043 RepID=UPI002AD38F81|nr:uncharacterized protein LOC133452277 [Cololabis saira]
MTEQAKSTLSLHRKPELGSLDASSPRASSPRASSLGASSPRASSPRASSPRASSPGASSLRASSLRASSPGASSLRASLPAGRAAAELRRGRGAGERSGTRRCGCLDMISFWLLCWKLLRATAGLTRTTLELTEGSHASKNNFSPLTQPEDSVTMEISSSSPLSDLERHSCTSQDVDDLQEPEVPGEENKAIEKGQRATNECHYLVFDTGDHKRKDMEPGEGGEQEEVCMRGETQEENDRRCKDEEEEDVMRATEEDKENEGDIEEHNVGEVEMKNGDGGERKGDNLKRRETEEEREQRQRIKECNKWVTEMLGEMKRDNLPELIATEMTECTSSDSSDGPEVTSLEVHQHDPGTRDDLSDSHLSDCLQAELAMISSDSDVGEEQWAISGSCDVTGEARRGEVISDGTCNTKRKMESTAKEEVEQESGALEQKEEIEDRGTSREDDENQRSKKDVFLLSPSVNYTAGSSDSDKKIPQDFCVLEETLSENVSTEHVDFLLACQQWKKMEEEVKGQPIPKPELRAGGSFQGTHSSLYPPTRSPRIKHREFPLSSTLSPSSEESGLDEFFYRSALEESESAIEREIRLTLEREEQHRRERGMIAQGRTVTRPCSLQTGRSPPRPPACRTPTLSFSQSPSCSSSLPRSVYHEMTANNVIILEPDSSNSISRSRLRSSGIGGFSYWPGSLDVVPSANVIVVETSNLIIRSASEFCLSSAPVSVETQESTFTSNPFYKLRSISSQSLVEQEIRMVRQREEEWRRQREDMWRKKREEQWKMGQERYDTVLVSPGLNENISLNVSEVPDRCVSSPSSPSRARKMEQSNFTRGHKFPPFLSAVFHQQNAMAQRWEASLITNQKKD